MLYGLDARSARFKSRHIQDAPTARPQPVRTSSVWLIRPRSRLMLLMPIQQFWCQDGKKTYTTCKRARLQVKRTHGPKTQQQRQHHGLKRQQRRQQNCLHQHSGFATSCGEQGPMCMLCCIFRTGRQVRFNSKIAVLLDETHLGSPQ